MKRVRDELFRPHPAPALRLAHPAPDRRDDPALHLGRGGRPTFVCNQLVEVMRTLIVIAVYLWAMFAMNTKLALVSLAFVPVVALSSGLSTGRIASRFKGRTRPRASSRRSSGKTLTGVRVVRASGASASSWRSSM